jgi:hypothetical protein
VKAKATNFMFGAVLAIIALATAPTCHSCEHRQTSAQSRVSTSNT